MPDGHHDPPGDPRILGAPAAFSPAVDAEVGQVARHLHTSEPATPTGSTSKRGGLGVVFWIAAGWVGLTVLLALLAPFLPLQSPTFQDYSVVNLGPSTHHLLGTDDLGRDMLSRIIWGSRDSLVISIVSVVVGMLIGGSAAMVAGYWGRKVDAVLNAASFVVLAFPPLLFILAVEAFWKPPLKSIELWKLVVMFTVVAAPQLFRVMRASTLAVSNREFVVAARSMGASTWRILTREILPNVLPAALSFALIGIALAVIIEGALAFLGLSVALPTPTLGNLINEAAQIYNLKANPTAALWPSLYIFFLVVGLNLMGDRLRSTFDVREGNL